MGYDMNLYKVDKNKLENTEDLLWQDIDSAIIKEVDSYYPVLSDFQKKYNLLWKYEEYNIVPEQTLVEMISWLKERIHTKEFLNLDTKEAIMTKYVYDAIKDWLPLKENEIIYFEEDS